MWRLAAIAVLSACPCLGTSVGFMSTQLTYGRKTANVVSTDEGSEWPGHSINTPEQMKQWKRDKAARDEQQNQIRQRQEAAAAKGAKDFAAAQASAAKFNAEQQALAKQRAQAKEIADLKAKAATGAGGKAAEERAAKLKKQEQEIAALKAKVAKQDTMIFGKPADKTPSKEKPKEATTVETEVISGEITDVTIKLAKQKKMAAAAKAKQDQESLDERTKRLDAELEAKLHKAEKIQEVAIALAKKEKKSALEAKLKANLKADKEESVKLADEDKRSAFNDELKKIKKDKVVGQSNEEAVRAKRLKAVEKAVQKSVEKAVAAAKAVPVEKAFDGLEKAVEAAKSSHVVAKKEDKKTSFFGSLFR